MAQFFPPAGVAARLRPRRQTLRLRLTLLYSGLFLVSGVVLLAITYVLVDRNGLFLFQATSTVGGWPGHRVVLGTAHMAKLPALPPGLAHVPGATRLEDLARKALTQHSSDVHELLIGSVVAIGVMAGLSMVLGWVVAGRALRPVRTMAATTQRISAHNLHERLAVDGPDDELKDLAGTIDGLLGRLEAAFAAQRHFVANASHELRTPLTLERTLLEVALADPRASTATLRSACERAIAAGEKHEELIESLLTLATSERGIDEHQPVDLCLVASHALAARRHDFEQRAARLHAELRRCCTHGDPRLIERLVENLVDNALRHNFVGGQVNISTGPEPGGAVLCVSNTGPPVPAEKIDSLLEPFQRLDDRADGFGLGLSIVKAIAEAHGANLECRPGADGGLVVRVTFPVSPAVLGKLVPSGQLGAGQPEAEPVVAGSHA
jgi:signal transduction histidine kinase